MRMTKFSSDLRIFAAPLLILGLNLTFSEADAGESRLSSMVGVPLGLTPDAAETAILKGDSRYQPNPWTEGGLPDGTTFKWDITYGIPGASSVLPADNVKMTFSSPASGNKLTRIRRELTNPEFLYSASALPTFKATVDALIQEYGEPEHVDRKQLTSHDKSVTFYWHTGSVPFDPGKLPEPPCFDRNFRAECGTSLKIYLQSQNDRLSMMLAELIDHPATIAGYNADKAQTK